MIEKTILKGEFWDITTVEAQETFVYSGDIVDIDNEFIALYSEDSKTKSLIKISTIIAGEQR